MDKEVINSIAEAIVSKQGAFEWERYALSALLLLLASAIGAYVGSYMKKRAELKAIKFEQSEILKQLKMTSRTTESIKNDIEHSLWKKKELTVLKSTKLELFLESIIEMRQIQEDMLSKFFEGKRVSADDYNMTLLLDKIALKQKIFFPEIKSEFKDLMVTMVRLQEIIFYETVSSSDGQLKKRVDEITQETEVRYHNLLHACGDFINKLHS